MEQKILVFLLQLPDDKRKLAVRVRDIMLSANASIKEAIKWRQLTFVYGKANIAFIYTSPGVGYINLGFFKATSLHDPDKLLEGTGKGMRHLKIHSLKGLPISQIKKWVKEAIAVEG